MTDDPNAPPAPARSADVFCTLKVPGELHAAFANVARARSRTIEWMVLEFMRASIGRWSPAQYKNEDDEPLIIAARRAFAAWRRYPNPQFLATVTLGGVLAKLRERAERTAGTGLGRPFAVAMNDLLERSGLVAIDKRARSCLVNCSEHRGAITKWIGKIPHKQRPVDPRQIWRRYQAQQRKSPPSFDCLMWTAQRAALALPRSLGNSGVGEKPWSAGASTARASAGAAARLIKLGQ